MSFFSNLSSIKKASMEEPSRHWDELPNDILKLIIEKLDFPDRIRLKSVCRSWNIQNNKRIHPLMVLPHDQNCKFLRCYSVSDGTMIDLKLPKSLQGGWYCGSSTDWIFIAKERSHTRFFKAKSEADVFLFNPNSGMICQLPPLSTIPIFRKFVASQPRTPLLSSFFNKMVISSSSDLDPWDRIIAASFALNPVEDLEQNDPWEDIEYHLGFCKPGHKQWTIFSDVNFCDILFFDGEMCLISTDTEDVGRRSLELASGEQIKLRIIPTKIPVKEEEVVHEYDNFVSISNAMQGCSVVESAKGEILLINCTMDFIFRTPNCDLQYLKTRKYNVYKVDTSNGNLSELKSLGDEVIFHSNTGPMVLPASSSLQVQPNCIYFVESNYYKGCHQHPWLSRELGIYNLDNGRICRCFPSIPLPMLCDMGWLFFQC